MNKGLQGRLAYTFIGIAAGVLLLASLLLIVETHYHFQMYQKQMPVATPDVQRLDYHVELALVQSIVWTLIGAILLAIVVSFYVAKRITAPLLDMRGIAQKMTEGQLQSRITIAGDDELAALGRSLNQLAAQLQKQEQLRKTMTADVAHELRTPLATLKSHMEALEDGIWEPTKERIHACYEEIERLIHLVGDLEQLTMVESPAFHLERKTENLTAIVQQSVEMVRAAYLQKGVELIAEASEPILLPLDRERVVQMMINLLSNALKYTPANETVRVALLPKADHVLVTVTDTGIGIPDAELPFIFDRFYRVEKSRNRQTGGSGIGLTIVKKIAEAHGGTVSATSSLGAGTTFSVRFTR